MTVVSMVYAESIKRLYYSCVHVPCPCTFHGSNGESDRGFPAISLSVEHYPYAHRDTEE